MRRRSPIGLVAVDGHRLLRRRSCLVVAVGSLGEDIGLVEGHNRPGAVGEDSRLVHVVGGIVGVAGDTVAAGRAAVAAAAGSLAAGTGLVVARSLVVEGSRLAAEDLRTLLVR